MPVRSLMMLAAATALWVATAPAAPAAPAAAAATAAPAASAACEPEGGLSFLCGPKRPEDLAALPGGRWLVASGMWEHAGLHLVDVRTHAWRRWIAPAEAKPARAFPACAAPPEPERFLAHGLSLKPHGRGWRLYVVGHVAREAVEVFDVDLRGPAPRLTWVGCVPMPDKLSANSVTATPDGAILVTVLAFPGLGLPDAIAGRNTGAVFEWRPGSNGFRRVSGTELPSDNGIESSPDGKILYVVSSGRRTVTAFTHTDPARPLKVAQLSGFTPDNVHWGPDGRLYVAGMTDNEPACGGPPKPVDGKLDLSLCHRGYHVAAIDPQTMTAKIVARGPATADYTGVATALPAGGALWFGSFLSDRIAYRPFP
jgi:hypothetical protein